MTSQPRTGLWRRFVRWGDNYFSRDWPLVTFQPLLMLMVWGASIRLFTVPGPNVPIERIFGDFAGDLHLTYHLWLGFGLTGPVLTVLSWFLIRRRQGRRRVFGFGLRLTGDIALFVFLLAYHVAVVSTTALTENKVVSRYVFAAAMLFMVEAVIRDLWAIRLNEKRTRKIEREHRE